MGLLMPVHTVCVIPDSDVPALQTVTRLPPRVVQSLRGARDLPEPLRSAVVPHSLRLTVPPQLCVPHLWYIFRIIATVYGHTQRLTSTVLFVKEDGI